MEPLAHSDFIREMQRLLAQQTEALRSKDVDAIDHAASEMALFLRYNHTGRLAEYFALRAARRPA